jgi:hypothetical protein
MTLRALLLLVITASLPAQVPFKCLLRAALEPQNWFTCSHATLCSLLRIYCLLSGSWAIASSLSSIIGSYPEAAYAVADLWL